MWNSKIFGEQFQNKKRSIQLFFIEKHSLWFFILIIIKSLFKYGHVWSTYIFLIAKAVHALRGTMQFYSLPIVKSHVNVWRNLNNYLLSNIMIKILFSPPKSICLMLMYCVFKNYFSKILSTFKSTISIENFLLSKIFTIYNLKNI